MKTILALSLLAAPAFAGCPAGTDYSSQIATVVERMQMWDIWLDAPDELAQAMLDAGMASIQMGDRMVATSHLEELVAYCPDYAEGYNQRAFASFLQGKYDDALVDLDAAIALQPVHLGALTGKALTLIELGRAEDAQDVLHTALAINPWLAERALLNEPQGEDI